MVRAPRPRRPRSRGQVLRGGRALLIVAALGACAHPKAPRGSVRPSPAPAPEGAPAEAPDPPASAAPASPAAEPVSAPESGAPDDDFSSPDRDFDGDGIPDRDDACPTEPEVYDGGRDDDGCPGAA